LKVPRLPWTHQDSWMWNLWLLPTNWAANPQNYWEKLQSIQVDSHTIHPGGNLLVPWNFAGTDCTPPRQSCWPNKQRGIICLARRGQDSSPPQLSLQSAELYKDKGHMFSLIDGR
jgi:hypothetical protein